MSEERFEQRLSDELASFESTLRRLSPAAGRIDRDRLMFRAGCASAATSKRTHRWLWPGATAAMTLVSATLAVLLAQRDRQLEVRPPSRSVAAPHQPPAATHDDTVPVHSAPSELAYFTLRNAVLQRGVDALPNLTLAGETHPTCDANWLDLRRRLITPQESTNDPTARSGEHS